MLFSRTFEQHYLPFTELCFQLCKSKAEGCVEEIEQIQECDVIFDSIFDNRHAIFVVHYAVKRFNIIT